MFAWPSRCRKACVPIFVDCRHRERRTSWTKSIVLADMTDVGQGSAGCPNFIEALTSSNVRVTHDDEGSCVSPGASDDGKAETKNIVLEAVVECTATPFTDVTSLGKSSLLMSGGGKVTVVTGM